LTDHRPIHLPFLLRLLRRYPIPHKLGLMDRLFGKTLLRYGASWVTTSNGVIWKLNLEDITERWIVYGDYEGPLQMNWIRAWLADGGTVVDSGVNIGQMLLFMAPLPEVSVHAFEPLPEAYKWMSECVGGYPEWKIKLNQYGLSSSHCKINIQVDGARSTARMDWYEGKNFPLVEITVKTLDEYLQQEGIEQVRLWKLDVEGHELEALNGARKYLQKHKIGAILIEVSSQLEVTRFLKKYGYELYMLRSSGQLKKVVEKMTGTCNMIALPNEI